MKHLISSLGLLALPLIAMFAGACSDDDAIDPANGGGTAGLAHGGNGGHGGSIAAGGNAGATTLGDAGGSGVAGAAGNGAGGAGDPVAGAGGAVEAGFGGSDAGGEAGAAGQTAPYMGPSVGTAKSFAALAYSAVTSANISPLTGAVGVSAGAVSNITGFDAVTDVKYGTDSLAPNSQRTILAQGDVTSLVGNIDPRPCDQYLTDVVGGLTGDVTLHPGVTCMNSFSADVLINGKVTLDAAGDSNAYFIIRSNLTLTVADGAQIVLAQGAQACGVFWRVKKQVTIGKTVKFYGNVIAGTAITMNTGSTLVGRALAQTAAVALDANTITIPLDQGSGVPGACTHVQ